MSGVCHYCGPTERELRPYGPGGSDVCVPCVEADPAREAAAKGAFLAQLEMAEAISPVVVIGNGPPTPFPHSEEFEL